MSEKIPTNLSNREDEIHHKEIAQIEEPLKKIFEQISDNFEKGEYDLMIGIDASGRIPALILFKLATNIYEKNGYPAPMFRFIAGHAPKDGIREIINKWNPKKRVLIIEDLIGSGNSIRNLAYVLDDLHIKFDISTISGNADDIKDRIGTEHSQNVYTADSSAAFGLTHHRDLHGVQKKRKEKQVFSKIYDKEDKELGHHRGEFKLDSREDVDTVASHLIDWYESKNRDS